jgi:hypothetical protein
LNVNKPNRCLYPNLYPRYPELIRRASGRPEDQIINRADSLSDSITKNGRTKVRVVWELSAKKIDNETSEYSNRIHASATDEMLEFIKEHGITFEQAAAARQAASDVHNKEETSNFAQSI